MSKGTVGRDDREPREATLNIEDQQAIEGLFRHMSQTAQQAGPRDPQAEALIEQHLRQAPPGILYHMAQTLIAQQHALSSLRARAANGAPAGFGQPSYAPQPGYAQPGYAQPGYGAGYPQQRRGGGFLAGAGKIALGVGGGILGAEVADDIFHGVENMFDGNREREQMYAEQQFADQQYDQGYQQGMDAGEQRDMAQFDQGQQFDSMQQFDQGGFDNGQFDQGGFDQGGFDQGGFDQGGFDNGGGFL